MESSIVSIFAGLGLPGLMLAVIVWMQILCSRERTDTREHYDKVLREVTQAFRDNTSVTHEIKELLASFQETIRRCEHHSK
jgi:TRAP-type C4-dicarboxylate transport system permease large subunit